MTRPEPEGVERVSLEEHPENKVGRQVYTHRLDPSEFRKDRDFRVEWVDGPVRFSIERDDHGGYWLFKAAPAGKAGRMRDGHEKDKMAGMRGGGSGTQRTTVSPAHEGFQESFGKGDIIFVKSAIDLFHNPFEVRWDYDKEAQGHLGSVRTFSFTIDTPEDSWEISRGMVKSQLKTLARHSVEKAKYIVGTEEGREKAKNRVTSPAKYQKSRAVKAVVDTAYVLGLRERTSYATGVHKTDHPCPPDEGAREKLSPVAEKVAEGLWKAGLKDKPAHAEWQEKLQERQQHPQHPQQQQRAPPTKPINNDVKEKDNRCPECEGRYHEKDLVEKDFEENYTSGTAYHCPDCDSIVAGDTSYHGPEPTPRQTYAGR